MTAGKVTSTPADWRPGASLATLQFNARLRRRLRAYFDVSGALEVATPVLSQFGPSEPSIEAFDTCETATDGRRWLQTSPEFPMKRLIAAYGQDIWQLAPVFRRAERGEHHNCEFQLLEWYRIGADLDALMNDVAELLKVCVGQYAPFRGSPTTVRYGLCVREATGSWPEELEVADIATCFSRRRRHFPNSIEANEVDAALDLLFNTFVVPGFATDKPTFVIDYPQSQASLARFREDEDGRCVAARFELYAGPVELANGYHELVDPDEQRHRFEQERELRKQRGQVVPPLDEPFLAALAAGLPDCAGVALGLDRMAMVALGAPSIDAVMSFSDERA